MSAENTERQHKKGHGHPSAFVPHGLAVGYVQSGSGTHSAKEGFFSGRNPVVGSKLVVVFWLREQMPDDGEFGFHVAYISMSGHIIEVLPDGRFRADLKNSDGPLVFRGRWVVELRYDPSYSDAWVVDAMVPYQNYKRADFLWQDALRTMQTREQDRLRYAQHSRRRRDRSAPTTRTTASTSTAPPVASTARSRTPAAPPRTPPPTAPASATPAATLPVVSPPRAAPKAIPSRPPSNAKPTSSNTVFTVGHSNHTIEQLINLLLAHQVTAVADVRSIPASTRNPQFNAQALQRSLKGASISYVFLGKELGARPEDRSCYVEGKVQYGLLAETAVFQSGLDRVLKGVERHRIALFCAEKDPLACHRTILVARHLVARGLVVSHILDDGRLEPHEAAINRLLVEVGLDEQDLLLSRDELADQGYRRRGEEIGYMEKSSAVT